MTTPAPEIFKAYDIRGIVGKTLTAETVALIGQAIGSEALARGQRTIVVGRDGRLSGTDFATALEEGITSTGIDVIDIGCVATPVVYFAAHHLQTANCVAITGSHNPPDYNGLKMVLAGETLHGEQIQALRRRILDADFVHGAGRISRTDVRSAYIERIAGDVKLARPLRIALDSGNGAAGNTAPELFRRLGCELVELFSEVDGRFPNHHPDPSRPENLEDLIAALKASNAELGLAFDGDGDRLGVVTKDGEIIYPDRQLMLFAADVLTRVPSGKIVFDAKCTRHLAPWIREHGGEPVMGCTGHALVKAKMRESSAVLGGELSGHIFFAERWYGFDDGIYAGARLLEILSRSVDANAPLKALPNALSTPELNIPMNEGEAFELVARLKAGALFADEVERVETDGLRVEFSDGFGLARASNTTPVLVLRFEADDPAALARIQSAFADALRTHCPAIALPF
ncbi:phosphomannomutase/phosphoglucomutase [Niveibacterium terrae]|uniref:phosphomannomutase/phosphoglucomutase n=1 Tax=Niveibacterium terrae TaxID=3373598 RepID=UPI003A936E0E